MSCQVTCSLAVCAKRVCVKIRGLFQRKGTPSRTAVCDEFKKKTRPKITCVPNSLFWTNKTRVTISGHTLRKEKLIRTISPKGTNRHGAHEKSVSELVDLPANRPRPPSPRTPPTPAYPTSSDPTLSLSPLPSWLKTLWMFSTRLASKPNTGEHMFRCP